MANCDRRVITPYRSTEDPGKEITVYPLEKIGAMLGIRGCCTFPKSGRRGGCLLTQGHHFRVGKTGRQDECVHGGIRISAGGRQTICEEGVRNGFPGCSAGSGRIGYIGHDAPEGDLREAAVFNQLPLETQHHF